MTGPRAYVDHAATTPLRPEALEAMLPFLTQDFANPSGAHAESRIARVALDDARDQIGALLGVGPGEVVLTSGGTEADDLAIQGGWDAVSAHGEPKGRHAAPNGGLGAPNGAPGATPVVVCAAMEHHAVLEACRALAQRTGAVLRCVPSDAEGIVDLDALAEACDAGVRLVSVMTVNNEVGTIQPLAYVARLVAAQSPGAVLHTDAVQAVPWLDIATVTAPADLVSVSAHKFGGPKGMGALVLRHGALVRPGAGTQKRHPQRGRSGGDGSCVVCHRVRACGNSRPGDGLA